MEELGKKNGLCRLHEMKNPDRQHLELSDQDNAQTGLLFSVLALIFMSNDVVTDETLFKFLECVVMMMLRWSIVT